MSLPIYKGKCQNCGREEGGYVDRQWYYGSPVRQCKKCGFTYLDKRYHEIETDGCEPDALSVKRSAIVSAAGLAAAVLGAAITAAEIHLSGKYHLSMVFIALIGLALVIFGIVDAVRIKTGLKAKKLEKLRTESEERLKNREYAQLLKENGYNVPEKYLNEQ